MTKVKCCRMLLHSPHIFRLQSTMLWPSCALGSPGLPHRQQAGLAVGVAENLFCRVHSVCTSTHSRIQPSPHDSDPPHASLHHCCRELHHPDTILCHDSKAAQPSSTTHSCPSSPKSLHRILTHVILTLNSASPAYSTQNKPVTVPSRYYIQPVSGLPASCTPAHLHAHASLRVLNISNLTTILSQQQLRGQSPAHEARFALTFLSAPVKARCRTRRSLRSQ